MADVAEDRQARVLGWPRLRAFARRHGKPQVRLAMHASLPTTLTPELLNLVRVNFVPEAHFITEADLLLSELVRERGGGYYEMDPEIRELLLRELRREHGEAGILRVADFLYSYCENRLCGEPTATQRDFLRVQTWTALSYLDPPAAAQGLAQALNEGLGARDPDQTHRLLAVIQRLEVPLAGEGSLARYCAGIGRLLAGDRRGSDAVFQHGMAGTESGHRIGSVELPPPASVAGWAERPRDQSSELGIDERATSSSSAAASESAEDDTPSEVSAGDEAFELDVFFSYTQLDNEALTADEQGWVSAFESMLQTRLSQLLGRKASIWRDPKLQGNDVFADGIFEQFPKLKTFVSIISPRYVNSEWCRRELQEFYKAAQSSGGVLVGNNKSRIFKIIKLPVDNDAQPPEIADLLGYPFYQEDENGRIQEFILNRGSPTYRQSFERIDDVAQDVCQVIRMLDKLAAPADAPLSRIYLMSAESDYDAAAEIDDYLFDQGYEVVHPIFDGEEAEIREVRQEDLRACDGVLIYVNQATESWLMSTLRELRKALLSLGGEPPRAIAVYLGGEGDRFKERFRTRQALVIKQFGVFSEEDLAPFLAQLQNGAADG